MTHLEEFHQGKGNRESLKNALQCIVTSFQLLSGQGEALDIDLKDFYNCLYSQMIQLSFLLSKRESCAEMELLLKALELMFYKKKHIPIERVAAFTKRLAYMSLYLSSNETIGSLAMIKSLFIKFPRLDSFLDVESKLDMNLFQPFVEDPELSHSLATNIWELSLLQVI